MVREKRRERSKTREREDCLLFLTEMMRDKVENEYEEYEEDKREEKE
jgi:hypothetical protein